MRVFCHTAHIYGLIYEASGKHYAAESTQIHADIQRRNPRTRTLPDARVDQA